MHNFRLRWVALGLLIYVQGAICRTSPLCPTAEGGHFDDVPSRTVGAKGIVQVTAQQVRPLSGEPGKSHVKFHVEQIYKWDQSLPLFPNSVMMLNFASNSTNSSRAANSTTSSSSSSDVFCEAVLSGLTHEPKKSTKSSSPSTSGCVAHTDKAEVKRLMSYMIFIGHIGGTGLNNNSDYVIFKSRLNGTHAQTERLPVSGSPLRVTKSVLTDVKRFVSCSKCRRKPRTTLHPTVKEIVAGNKLSLHCRVSGKPRVIVTWFKDDVPLAVNDRRVVIKTNARTSQLQIRRATVVDTGTYGCQARTVLMESERQLSTIIITSDEAESTTLPFGESCPQQHHNYCLNGGTCVWLTRLNTKFCQCRGDYEGERCREKKTFLGSLTKRKRRHHHHQPHHFIDNDARYLAAISRRADVTIWYTWKI